MSRNIEKVVTEAVKIYFDYDCSAKTAIEKAKELIEDESMAKMEKAN